MIRADRARRRGAPRRLPAFLLAAALAAPFALPAFAQDDDPNLVYEFEAALAPVCVDGTFPFQVETEGGIVAGTLVATTDARGRVTGSLDIGGSTLAVTGKVKYSGDRNTLKLVARGPDGRLTCKGDLETGAFAGVSKGKGEPAAGKNTFTLDLSSASNTEAAIQAVFLPGQTGRTLKGTGSVTVCGDPVELVARRKSGKAVVIKLKGDGFSWKATLAGTGESMTATWKAKGFGARADGATLPVLLLDPPSAVVYSDGNPEYEAEEPIDPNTPSVGGGEARWFTVSPALPAGLVFDLATGVLTGTPTDPAAAATYTVTAGNAAGSVTADLPLSVRINRGYSFATETRALDDDDRRHFLARTHFGVRDDEFDALVGAGLDAFIDDMLEMRTGTQVETDAFVELVNANDPPDLQGGFPSRTDLSRWWERIMVETDRPFQESMALFWHDHFGVSHEVFGGSNLYYVTDHVNLLRRDATGNLRDLLLDVARDPAMLIFLDGFRSTASAPNENFAREFWELFTLGVDSGYTQADIVEASRAFTGWRQRYDAVTARNYIEYQESRHDSTAKTILGVTIPGQANGDDFEAVVDITLAERPVEEFIARKIFRWFVHDSPPDALIAEMGDWLRDSDRDGIPNEAEDWELAPLLRQLFRSEAFFSNKAKAGLVKSPLDAGVGFIRSTGLRYQYSTLDYWFRTLGQQPTNPPTVDGWPAGELWLSAASMVDRTNLVYYAVEGTNYQRNTLGIEVADILPPVEERTDTAVLDQLEHLLNLDLSDAERTQMIEYLNTDRLSNGSVIDSPFDGSNQTHLDQRVRGLLWILSQHPSFHVK